MQDCFTLISNSKDFPLPMQFQKMNCISPEILVTLIKDKKYEIKTNVCEEALQIFIQYLIDGIKPRIYIDMIREFIQLSQEFQIKELQEQISNTREKFLQIESSCDNQYNSQEQVNSNKEIIESINNLIQSYYNMEKGIEDLKNQYVETNSILLDQQQRIKELFEIIEKQNEEIHKEVKMNQDDLDNRIQNIREEIDSNQTKLIDLYEKNVKNENNIAVLNSNIEQLNKRADKINTHISEIKDYIDKNNQIFTSKYITKNIHFFFLYEISLFLLY